MIIIYTQVIGCVIFTIAVIILGILLKRYPSMKVLEKTNLIFYPIAVFAFLLPVLIGLFYPGLKSYDKLLGINPLPFKLVSVIFGIILLLIGIIFVSSSGLALLFYGQNQDHPAFSLTSQFVKGSVYKLTRNPMSLGFCSGCLALGLLSGSTYFTLWLLIEMIPSHIFYLKFYEERELSLRFGSSYLEYKNNVPFLIPRLRNNTEKDSANIFE